MDGDRQDKNGVVFGRVTCSRHILFISNVTGRSIRALSIPKSFQALHNSMRRDRVCRHDSTNWRQAKPSTTQGTHHDIMMHSRDVRG
jgi:hypothetical protein